MMDALDTKILARLTRDGRCKASALSRELNLSVSAVIERIRKLESGGIIRGYAAVLDQKRLGNEITVWMEVSLDHPKHYDAFAARVLAAPNILACHYVTGGCDFILHAAMRDAEALETLHAQVSSYPGVSSVKTLIELKAVKEVV